MKTAAASVLLPSRAALLILLTARTVAAVPTLVGAGFFEALPGCAACKSIAQWTGTEWTPLANGGMVYDDAPGLVYAVAPLGAQIVAGGYFNRAGGVPANGVARWDGATWHPLGSGVGDPEREYAYAFVQFGTSLVATGYFQLMGGKLVNNIAQWDGAEWWPLGLGITDTRDGNALAVYRGELIVGGDFSEIGGYSTDFLARWDGSSGWSPILGLDNIVWSLEVYDGDLFVGGWFEYAGSTRVSNVARWDGAGWSATGTGVPTGVFDFFVLDGLLVAGGMGARSDEPTGFVAAWNGTSKAWTRLGGPEFRSTGSLAALDGDLVAAATLTDDAGNTSFTGVARLAGTNEWGPLTSDSTGIVCILVVEL